MPLSTQPYKGARDFYPEDKRIQNYLFATLSRVVEGFGYEEYTAPILEPLELYLSKTSDEIVNEQTYTFTDRGDRQVAIRPEMTPSVSRMVAARRQELAYPLRWYSIPNLWRYERPQRGRLREHWQLNVDLFGVAGLEADFEMLQIADTIMRAFKAKRETYSIKLNSRQLTNALMSDVLGADDTQATLLIRLIDRMHKMEYAEFAGQVDAAFSPSQRDQGATDTLLNYLKTADLNNLPEALKAHESIKSLRQILALCDAAGITNVTFDPTLMRGFDYYTDIVFEVFDTHPENNRSMFGGGRYDGLVGMFGVEPVPTVGFGMGDVTLQNFLETHDLLPKLMTETEVYAVLVGDVYEPAQKIVTQLRRSGVKTAVDITKRKLDKQLKTADKKGIRYALIIGEKELADEQFVLRNLHDGSQETHSIERIISIIKDFRNKE